MIILMVLGLFIIVTAVRSMIKVATRVLVVGLIIAVLLGTGVIQIPGDMSADVPDLDDTVTEIGSTITGLIGATDLEEMEEENIPEIVGNITGDESGVPD